MPRRIIDLLAQGTVITDGAWGTQLQARGLAPGEFPDAWNLTHPDLVEAVARAYVEAGSQVILTNTFGANRIRLTEAGLGDAVEQINRRGVEISRHAAGDRRAVFASLGPTGRMPAEDDLSRDDLRQLFAEQAHALADAGADALVIETMSDLVEATAALEAARGTGLPIVACMVFDTGRNRDRTMMGTTPEEAASALTHAGADVIGANCGQGIDGFVPLCRRLRAATSLPLWIKANAGMPVLEDGRVTYPVAPDQFARRVPDLIDAGASFIGGCCGTSPDFVRALRDHLA